jgi:purine-binding chemotaxis protein CheW
MSAEAPLTAPVLPEAPAAPVRRACVVLLGGRPFAVDVAEAREVVVLDTTTPVPGAPAPVIGVMNLRGSVLPVVEARPLLGLPVRSGGPRGRALVLADGDRRAAILIERVLGLGTLDEVEPLPAPDASGLTVGLLPGDAGDRPTLLDARAVLAALRRPWDSTAGGSR